VSTIRHTIAPESFVIGLGADHERERGFTQLIPHPARPAFGRRTVHVPIEASRIAVIAQSLSKAENTLAVFLGIVALADEDKRG
jgi:hypothetical protein